MDPPGDLSNQVAVRKMNHTFECCSSLKLCGSTLDEDEYATKPRLYWRHDLEYLIGKKGTMKNQPTHWMPCPEDPD